MEVQGRALTAERLKLILKDILHFCYAHFLFIRHSVSVRFENSIYLVVVVVVVIVIIVRLISLKSTEDAFSSEATLYLSLLIVVHVFGF